MKLRVFLVAIFGLTALTLTLVVRAATMPLPPPPAAVAVPEALASLDEADLQAAAERLAGALRFPTTSQGGFLRPATPAPEDDADAGEGEPRERPANAFEGLLRYLAESFPQVHAKLAPERVGELGLLFSWRPELPAEALLLVCHLDVVPAGNPEAWKQPPFSGAIVEGEIWGRGALDDKGSCLAVLEATERLLGAGFEPKRPVLLAMGMDEEIGGRGAQEIAAHLAAKGVRAHLVLDEGLAVTEGVVKGLERPAALIGLAEKRYFTVELKARAKGGHSSMPPARTAIGRLGEALARLEQHQLPASLDGPAGSLLDGIAPELPFGQRLGIANRWLLAPVLAGKLAAQPATNALIRTTTAPTLFSAGVKENVLATEANATVNFRIRPGETGLDVMEHVRQVVQGLEIEVSAPGEPPVEESPVSPAEGAAYEQLRSAIAAAFPDALIAPSLVLGATDARHYTGLSRSVYRFGPWRLDPEALETIHGHDERVPLAHYGEAIRFYGTLVQAAAGG
ncbi:MAG: M20/M25/M40 family metallo-hydrolase [Deltaproteobacteria bacterium]|nr:M20/M25/M40 family metallo-hydrolase [Deltaproteobacteria bacterium]